MDSSLNNLVIGTTSTSGTSSILVNNNYCTYVRGVLNCTVNSGTTTAYEHKVINKDKGDCIMCGHIFLVGAVLIVGYIFGKGWDWRYKIVQKRSSMFEVWFRPSWWPFWLDQGPYYGSLDEAKAGLEIFKKSGNDVQVD